MSGGHSQTISSYRSVQFACVKFLQLSDGPWPDGPNVQYGLDIQCKTRCIFSSLFQTPIEVFGYVAAHTLLDIQRFLGIMALDNKDSSVTAARFKQVTFSIIHCLTHGSLPL